MTEQNFDISRRDLLRGGLAAAAVPAVSAGAFYFGYSKVKGSPVRVGVVGTGDEGSVLLGAINPDYIQVVSIADVRPYNQHRAFHGDCYSDAALKARPGLMSVYNWKTEAEARSHVKVYQDYNELIANAKADGVEAIIIGLPLHLHAPATVKALRLGLHVLTEKLMGHSVANCKEMARQAKLSHRHLATGHQRHYNVLYAEAVDTIRRGVLGNIHYIRAQWHRGNSPGSDSWQQPMPKEIKPDDSLANQLARELASWRRELDSARGADIASWSRKIAQKEAQLQDHILAKGGEVAGRGEFKSAKGYGYEDGQYGDYKRPAAEELLRWRLWSRTGGGLMVELGSHQLDAASIFLAANNDYYLDRTNSTKDRGQKIHPLRVHVSANRNLFGLDRQVNDHITTLVEFPAPDYDPTTISGRKRKICVQYSTINGNGFGGYGEMVFGTAGTMLLATEATKVVFRSDAATKVSAKAGAEAALDTQSSGPAQKAAGGGTADANVSRGYKEELEHWAWCIRENPNSADPTLQPRCHPKIALGDAVIALVTNIAAEQGKSVAFKEEWFDPDHDATPETDILNDPKGKPDLNKSIYG
ncbi:MAG: Gfo/Idh/MocA family oxidoreductase [Planctomycetaceae bacterium]|jgi:predicted dehydrogenase|nr:Gfo/Idh/MocA family oxidoreductase [Planctomycetaceae bacterium]